MQKAYIIVDITYTDMRVYMQKNQSKREILNEPTFFLSMPTFLLHYYYIFAI